MTARKGVAALIAALWMGLPSGVSAQTALVDGTVQTIQVEAGTGKLLRFDRDSESVFVANPAVAEVQPVSPTLAYLTGTRTGVTDVFAIDENEGVIGAYRVVVRESATAAREVNPSISSGSSIDFAGRVPVIGGTVEDVGAGLDADVLRRSLAIDNPGAIDKTEYRGATQVNLRVRFVEVKRANVNNLGINFDALTNVGNFTLGLATGTAVVGVDAVTQGLTTPANTFGQIGVGFNTSSTSAESLIDALAQTDAVEVLAEPTLTTVTGREATFLAGGEFPIVIPQDDGAFTTEFREFGVSLAFLPTILPNDRIALQVAPEVSTLNDATGVSIGGVRVPGLSTRRISTTVELGSGQTFAIGGLFQSEISDSLSELPGVNQVPVLGKLFSSRRFRRNETELLVLITPYLVGDGSAEVDEAAVPMAPPKLAGFMFGRGGSAQ